MSICRPAYAYVGTIMCNNYGVSLAAAFPKTIQCNKENLSEKYYGNRSFSLFCAIATQFSISKTSDESITLKCMYCAHNIVITLPSLPISHPKKFLFTIFFLFRDNKKKSKVLLYPSISFNCLRILCDVYIIFVWNS